MFAAGGLNREDFIFRKKKGEVLVKKPGSINGQAFVIEDLQDCTVYILDWTAQVQIDDCTNCKIFIGPVNGSAFFRDCTNCQIGIACRQFRTRDCKKLDVSIYCNSQPSIETTSEMQLSCWRGAYPKLTEHFAAANLDPLENSWQEVYDFNTEDETFNSEHGTTHWHFHPSPPSDWWEVPLEGMGACENPVLSQDGTAYVPSGAAAGTDAPTDAPPTPANEEGGQAFEEPAELQDGSLANPLFSGPPQGGNLDPVPAPAPVPAQEADATMFGGAPEVDAAMFGGAPEADAGLFGGAAEDDAAMFAPPPAAAAAAAAEGDDFFGGTAPAPAAAGEGGAYGMGAAPDMFGGGGGDLGAAEDPAPGFGLVPNGGEPAAPDPAPAAYGVGAGGLGADFGSTGHARAREIAEERVARKNEEEQAARAAHLAASREFIDSFVGERSTNYQRRQASNRDAEALLSAQQQSATAAGGNVWESIAQLIDFSFARPNGTDLARYKSVLFTLKNRPGAPGGTALA